MTRLSIAIPTYNRGALLDENLRSLLREIDTLDESVDIVVSDNASADDTGAIVAALIADGAPITYHRNATNMGMDENADLAVRRSGGQYVLLLGDDDMMEPGSLAAILQCLDRHPDLGLLYLNFRIYDGRLEAEIDFRDQAFDPVEQDSYFSDGGAVVEKTRKIFAAISGGVYRRDLWEQAAPRRFYGTIFIHVGITLDILCRRRAPAYIFKRPLFKYRLNDSAPGRIKPYRDIFAVSFGLLRILAMHKRYIPKPVYREMYQRELWWSREKILGAKARQPVPVLETARSMLACYDTARPDFWCLDLPMLVLPRWLLNMPYQLYRVIKYGRRGKNPPAAEHNPSA